MMRLGSYNFEWNPDMVTIPETSKTAAKQDTYAGSVIFQWEAFLKGTLVELSWEWMTVGQYESLRLLYLSTDEIRWVAAGGQAFTVIVTNLSGRYFESARGDLAYRRDVSMTLDLRAETSALTTTTV